MTSGASGRDQTGETALRRVPSQKRSQERVEKILAVAIRLIEERGLDGVKMSEVAEQADISIGSLYQYFPDKAAIVRSLADRYNAEGRACTDDILAATRSIDDLRPALIAIADGFYAMYRRHPAMRALWRAMQGDAALQAIDADDEAYHARALRETLTRLDPRGDPVRHKLLSGLLMNLLAAAVRHAIGLTSSDGEATMALYNEMLTIRLRDALA